MNNQEPQLNRSYFDNVSFFSKQFCLPKQIKLVDYQDNNVGRQMKNNIQIIDRVHYLDINPVIRDIIQINLDNDSKNCGDGLISLVSHMNIKVCICITVFSEDKKMLKKTLQGIKKNYQEFYKKAGIHSHQIVIIIMFDGIQHLNDDKQSDRNMFNLFRQFDLINGFRRKQYLLAKQQQSNFSFNEKEQESQILEIENFSDEMLFTEAEYEDIQLMLLEEQYKKYIQMNQLINFSENIEKYKFHLMSIQQLPSLVRQNFAENARIYLQSNGINEITQNNLELQVYIQSNLPQEKIQSLKLDSLTQAIKLAKQYLKSRQNSALLYQMSLPLLQNSQKQGKMYLFTVIKYMNRGKLSSHLWFFQGFCSMINPSVSILLDCGSEPYQDSIFKMWSHIQTYKDRCGGVCGYMKLRKQSPYDDSGNRIQKESESLITNLSTYFVDIQKSQIFQYHFAHLLDKPFEGLTGYIHVLPGAFSGYNWDALRNQKFKVIRSDGQIFQKDIQKRTKQQILKKYLKTVIYNEILDDIAEANMYLAEDRILCLEIFTKKKSHYTLQYLPDAQAVVDPIPTVPKLISQRKRWINGSWFALQYVLKNKDRVNESSHSFWNKLWFHFNMFHAEIMRIIAYLSICFFFVTMHLMVLQFAQTTLKQYFKRAYRIEEQDLVYAKIFQDFFSVRSVINAFTGTIDFLYIISIGILVYKSLTLKKQSNKIKRSFNTIATWLGVFGLFSIILIFINFIEAIFNEKSDLIKINGIFTQQTFIYLLIGIVGAHFLIVLSAFNCYTYYEVLTSLFSYFFYIPAYINLFFVYSFCRIDDLSWGTKGLDSESKSSEQKVRIKFANEKIKFALKWLGTNIILSLILVGLANNYDIQNYIIWIFSAYFALVLALKTIFVFLYLFLYYTCKNYQKNQKIKEIKKMNNEHEVSNHSRKQEIKNYIQKMKDKQIDDHINHLRDEHNLKKLMDEAYERQKNQLMGFGKPLKLQEKRISFRDLQRFNEEKISKNLLQ